MTQLQVRLMTSLLHLQGKDAGVTHIAALFGLSKSTISRGVQELVQQGLLLKYERALALSEIGKKQAQEYEAQFQKAFHFLCQIGVPPEQAAQDSYALLLKVTQETRSALLARIRPALPTHARQYVAQLPDGVYDLPFAIYSTKHAGVRQLSMANDAFKHPAQLSMRAGKGVIRLQAVEVRHASAFHDQVLGSMLKSMSFFKAGRYHSCLLEGNTVCIPLHSLSLTAIAQRDLVIGEVLVNIVPNVEERHMPKSTALFCAYL